MTKYTNNRKNWFVNHCKQRRYLVARLSTLEKTLIRSLKSSQYSVALITVRRQTGAATHLLSLLRGWWCSVRPRSKVNDPSKKYFSILLIALEASKNRNRTSPLGQEMAQHRCSNKVGDNRCRYCSRCSRNECDRRRRLSELFEWEVRMSGVG